MYIPLLLLFQLLRCDWKHIQRIICSERFGSGLNMPREVPHTIAVCSWSCIQA